MGIPDLRKELEAIRDQAREGNLAQVVEGVDRALHAIEDTRLLTTTQAAELLGVRSVNTLKLLVRRSGIHYELHGNRMMIPIRELERIQQSPEVRGIRASDRAHDVMDETAPPVELSDEELDELEATRPGRPPWEG